MNGRKNKGRKNGSILIALLSGLLLIALGGVLLANRKYFFGLMEPRMFLGEQIINATVCFVFGAILLYWVYSSEDPGKDKLPAKDMFNKSWSRKFGQRDKWSYCLMAGTLCPSDQERP
jgi:hypothetical protein